MLAFVGAGADHHGAGDRPIRPVFEALAGDRPLLAPLGIRVECGHAACPLGAAAIVPLRLSDGPVGAVVAYATAGSPLDQPVVDLLERLGDQLSVQLQVSELTGATTAALQAQMEPHFVFNALNTIASLVRTDPDRARSLVLAFADYVRSKLSRAPELVTVEEELRHVQSYLDLEQARFGDGLVVTVDVSPDALLVRLPPFLVQPLVENAVKHGKVDRPLRLIVQGTCAPRPAAGDRTRRWTGHRPRGDRARARAGRVGKRGNRARPGERASSPDRFLRRGRQAALVPLWHGRAARGARAVKVVVVDDEAPARSELRHLLGAHAGVEVVAEAASAAEAAEAAPGCDAVFLDIELAGASGIDAARLLRGAAGPPAIVFVTAHAEYAVDAFAVEAFDYLLKPVDPERLARVVARLERTPDGRRRAEEDPCRRGRADGADRPGPGAPTSRPRVTTAACTPTTARTWRPPRSVSSRQRCRRTGSSGSIARTSSTSPRSPPSAAPVQTACGWSWTTRRARSSTSPGASRPACARR